MTFLRNDAVFKRWKRSTSIINSSSLAVQGVKTLYIPMLGEGFDPWSGNYDPQQHSQK